MKAKTYFRGFPWLFFTPNIIVVEHHKLSLTLSLSLSLCSISQISNVTNKVNWFLNIITATQIMMPLKKFAFEVKIDSARSFLYGQPGYNFLEVAHALESP